MGRKVRRRKRKRRMRSRSRRRRRKEREEVTDVRRARRRHLRRIRMRGREVRWPERGTAASGKKCYGRAPCSLWIIDQPRKGSKNTCAVKKRKSKQSSLKTTFRGN